MLGSSTRSTWTLFFPFQQSAFTTPPQFLLIAGKASFGSCFSLRFAINNSLGDAAQTAGANGLPSCRGYFTSLHQLFQAAQAFAHYLFGMPAGERSQRMGDRASESFVFQCNADLSAAVGGGLLEIDNSAMFEHLIS